ncbi:MAG: OmpA family protein [bacterium]|nr:OmpA family protein [bacterium]
MPRVKTVIKLVKGKGAPAYMVSFGDMMTLILCFFILLVSLAEERSYGLMAKGLGSFVIATKSHGLTGILDGHEKQQIFNQVRRRFNLPPEEDPERREMHEQSSKFELLRAEALQALEPHDEVRQPRVATFDPGSATLSAKARDYLDSWSDTLRPSPGQALLLEGHALPQETSRAREQLAFERAGAARQYLIEEHGFEPSRVEARAWLEEIVADASKITRSVDARLILPPKSAER